LELERLHDLEALNSSVKLSVNERDPDRVTTADEEGVGFVLETVGNVADLEVVNVRDQNVIESSSEGDLLNVGRVSVSDATIVLVPVGVSFEWETVHLLTLWVRLSSSVSLPDKLKE
jgi:hypothetical protein